MELLHFLEIGIHFWDICFETEWGLYTDQNLITIKMYIHTPSWALQSITQVYSQSG